VLAEAQSTWSVNIIFRLADYYFDSAMSYLKIRKADLHSSVKVDVPDVEAFVIYTGRKKVEKDILSLIQEFFGGNPNKPEFKAKIIHGEYKGGIIEEYMGFCRIWDENVLKANTPEEKQQAVTATIDLCIREGYLDRYLEEHRPEVEKIMIEMYNPRYVAEAERKTEIMVAEIAVLREAGISDDRIIEILVKRHGTTPAYARNLLDYKPDDHVVDAV
jgi:hypothetical protein